MAGGSMTRVATSKAQAGYYKRAYRKKRRYVKRRTSAMGVAKQALRLVKQLEPELKYHDVPFDQFGNYDPTTAANGGYLSLSLVPANAGAPSATTREDDEIRFTNLEVRGQIEYDCANYPYNCLRVIIFVDKDNWVTQLGQVLEVPSSIMTINSPYNYLNYVLNKKFTILYDTIFDSPMKNGTPVPGALTLTRHNIVFKKKLNLISKYDPVSATTVHNEIKMLVIGDVPFASKGGGLSFYGYSRVLFRED